MAAGDFLVRQGSAVSWAASGGTYLLTLTSLANNAGRKGARHDFGVTFPQRVRVQLKTRLAVAPTGGLPIYVYWASSADDTNYDGALAAGDAALSDIDVNAQLYLIGVLPADNVTTGQIASWVFEIPARYGFPVVYNASGQAFTSTAGDHELSLTPLIDQYQSA